MVTDLTRYTHGDRDEAAKAAGKIHNSITNSEKNRKGGKYYTKKLKYFCTGLSGSRQRVRNFHGSVIRKFKGFLGAENTQIHHDWIEGTAKYNFLALVDKEDHYKENFSDPVILFGSNGATELRTHVSEIDGKWYEKTVSHHPDGRATLIAACATVELSYKQHAWAHKHSVKELGEALWS